MEATAMMIKKEIKKEKPVVMMAKTNGEEVVSVMKMVVKFHDTDVVGSK